VWLKWFAVPRSIDEAIARSDKETSHGKCSDEAVRPAASLQHQADIPEAVTPQLSHAFTDAGVGW
jgi:hypothetical protein